MLTVTVVVVTSHCYPVIIIVMIVLLECVHGWLMSIRNQNHFLFSSLFHQNTILSFRFTILNNKCQEIILVVEVDYTTL